MEHWPPRHLVLRTPRLDLRPDDDVGLRELVDEAYRRVHPPDEMPFAVPWTDADPRYLGRGMLQHYWSTRAVLRPEDWTLNFLVRHGGHVVGVQSLRARDFAVTREVDTGSWIGLRHQRQGIGTEMRAAVLLFAFDRLGATTARSSARRENAASRGVSRRLGYRADGTDRRPPRRARRGRPPPGHAADAGPPGMDSRRRRLLRGMPRLARRDQPRLTPRAKVSHCDGSPVL